MEGVKNFMKNIGKIKFADSHPAAHALIACFASMLLVFIASNFIEALGSIVVMLCQGDVTRESMNELSDTRTSAVISLLTMAFILLCFWLRNRRRLHGFFNAGGTGAGLLLGWSEILINAFIIVEGLLSHKAYGNIITAILLGLQPGVNEEITFRIIPIAVAMRNSRRKQLVLPVVIFTSIVFGLSHGINIFAGADPVTTLFQVIYATGSGCLLAVIYMRTGNMWIPILLHSLTDIVYYLGAEAQSSGGVLTEGTDVSAAIILLIYAALYYVNAYLVYRKSTADAAADVWNGIWQCSTRFSPTQCE